MLTIKQGQQSAVESILIASSYGPQTLNSLIHSDNEPHQSLIIAQLLHAGCLCQIEDGRYLITQAGEVMLNGIKHNI